MGKVLAPVYAQSFFELQLHFAQKISTLSQQPLEHTILRCTAFYRIFGLDWSLDPTNQIWQSYLQGLPKGSEIAEIVAFSYQFYLERFQDIPNFADEEHWGCFAYDYNPETHLVRPHFSDQDTSGYGPLSSRRVDVRKAELRAMFQCIQERHPEATLVQGGSWLYNWESYRRLFPQAFVDTAKPQPKPGLTGRASWNQFLRRGSKTHQETMDIFLQRVKQLERVEDYGHCFPYMVLLTHAPIQLFYDFYDV